MLTSVSSPLHDCQSKQHRMKAVRRAEPPESTANTTTKVAAGERWKSLGRNRVSELEQESVQGREHARKKTRSEQ